MSIPFYDFQSLHHNELRKEIKERIAKIIDENSFIEGEYNQAFEQEFAKMQKAKHCLLLANGTDALEIALIANGAGHGDKIGVPGITFYATAEAVLNVGAIPVWIDVDSTTGLMCPDSLGRVHQEHSLKGIMPVHIYGLPAPMKEINTFAKANNLFVVEDAAQAQGACYEKGSPIGDTQNLVTFSFYPTKNLSAFGDAGCILTHDNQMAEKIKSIRNHGRGNEQLMGRNSRCDHIQAAVLHLKLSEIERNNNFRKNVAREYHNQLKNLPIGLLPEKFLELSSWHLYPIQLSNHKQRESLQSFLKEKEISCAPFYERALSQEPALSGYSGEDQKAKELAGRMLCLPFNPFLKPEQIREVTMAIKNFL